MNKKNNRSNNAKYFCEETLTYTYWLPKGEEFLTYGSKFTSRYKIKKSDFKI